MLLVNKAYKFTLYPNQNQNEYKTNKKSLSSYECIKDLKKTL